MQNRLLLIGVCWALLLPAALVADGRQQRAASNSASLKITFTIPQRITAAAYVASSKPESALCLITRGASEVSVNAVVRDAMNWQLEPVHRRTAAAASSAQGCDNDLALDFEIDSNWYSDDGVVTLLVSPL